MSLQKDIGVVEALGATSVRVGSILVPANSAESLLTRYSRQIFLVNDFPDQPYSICGSGTAVKYKDKHFVFCCQHQFRGFKHDQVAVVCKRDRNYLLHGSNLRIPKIDNENIDEEYIDICGFNFDVSKYDIENLTSEFFPLADNNLWPSSAKDKFIVIGYPTYEQNIEMPQRIQARVIIVSGKYIGDSSAQFVHKIQLERRRQFNCDGMSGGSVFYLGERNEQYFIGLAGMIIRGSSTSDEIYFVEARLLKYFADQADS